jgi:tetratricopeptide (TPR) repeat protein
MNFWDILGIKPTGDKNVIKEAYMDKLNLHHPEEDPEGFQTLRKAYETALKSDLDQGNNNLEDFSIEASPVKQWISGINKLYGNFFERIDADSWYDVLNEDICCQIDTSKEASYELLNFLMDNYYLPHKIWTILDEYFSWSEKKEELYEKFPRNFIDFISSNIDMDFGFRYELFKKDMPIDYDGYIKNYYEANDELKFNHIYQTRKILDNSLGIYPYHPDMRILNGRYYLATNNVDKAVKIFTDVILENKNDFEAHLNRGNAFLRLGRVNEASEDYNKALSLNPHSMSSLYGAADCCFSLRDFEKSKKLLGTLMDRYPYDREIRAKFISANYYLIDKYKKNPDFKHELARCYFNVNDFEKCYSLMKDIEKDTNMDFRICLLMGNTLKALNMEKEAELYMNKSIELNPDNWKAYYFKGLLFQDMGRYREALESYSKAESINDKYAILYNNKSDILCKLGEFEEAVHACDRAINLNPGLAHAHAHKAFALFQLGLYDAALSTCNNALKTFPYFLNLYLNKIKILSKLKRYKDIVYLCSKALKMNIEDSSIYYEKALALGFLDRPKESVESFHKAIKLNPGNMYYYYYLANVYTSMHEYKKAVDIYTAAIENTMETEYKYTEIYNERGLLYCELAKYDSAKQDFEKVLKLNPNHRSVYSNLGNIYGHLRQFKKSIEYYTRAIELNPEDATAYNGRGFSYRNIKKYDEAVSDYKQALKIDPNFLLAYNNLGILYFYDLSEYDKSLKYFNMALEISPDYHEAYNNIGLLYAKLKEYDKSLEYLSKALELCPDSELYNLNIGIVYERIKDYAKAIEYYERIIKINPNNERVKKSLKKLRRK